MDLLFGMFSTWLYVGNDFKRQHHMDFFNDIRTRDMARFDDIGKMSRHVGDMKVQLRSGGNPLFKPT